MTAPPPLAAGAVAAIAAAAARSVALLLCARAARARLSRLLPVPPPDTEPVGTGRGAVLAGLVAAAGAAAVAAPNGGPLAAVAAGGAVGIAAIWGLPRLLAGPLRPQPRPPAGLATALDLLGACLAAGSPVLDALTATAAALDAAPTRPLCRCLSDVAAGLRRGLPARAAWAAGLGARPAPGLAALARAAVRSERSGTALEEVLVRLAAEQRAAAALRGQAAARRAGVLAVLPLGLCFLPAYLLLGVVPAVVGLASRLR